MYVANENTNGAKYAKLEYEVLGHKKGLSLVKIKLLTGRTHQIRVQFASRGFSLVGDTKYGNQNTKSNGKTPISLFSYHLSFAHPISKRMVEAVKMPSLYGGFSIFKHELEALEKQFKTSKGYIDN